MTNETKREKRRKDKKKTNKFKLNFFVSLHLNRFLQWAGAMEFSEGDEKEEKMPHKRQLNSWKFHLFGLRLMKKSRERNQQNCGVH